MESLKSPLTTSWSSLCCDREPVRRRSVRRSALGSACHSSSSCGWGGEICCDGTKMSTFCYFTATSALPSRATVRSSPSKSKRQWSLKLRMLLHVEMSPCRTSPLQLLNCALQFFLFFHHAKGTGVRNERDGCNPLFLYTEITAPAAFPALFSRVSYSLSINGGGLIDPIKFYFIDHLSCALRVLLRFAGFKKKSQTIKRNIVTFFFLQLIGCVKKPQPR